MDKKRLRFFTLFLLIIFFAVDIVFASYIFSNTVRDNAPDWTFEPGSDIMYSSLSGAGEAFLYGSGNSIHFHYTMNPNASRSYTLDSRVNDLVISNNIKFFAVTDIENNYYFFRYGGGPDLDLKYKVSFEESVYIEGIVVLGKTAQNTRVLLRSGSSIYLFTSLDGEPVFVYDFNEDVKEAYISHYGDYVVAGTESGGVYFFRTFQENLEWQCKCDSGISSISVSPFAQYAIIGCIDGSVYLYDVAEQSLIWKKTIGASIESAYIRSTAMESLVLDATKTLHLFDREGTEIMVIENVETSYLPYWSEFLLYSVEGAFYLHREDRDVADWTYNSGEEIRSISSNYGCTTVMLTYKDKLQFFFEEQLIILGSRSYWAALALLVAAQLVIIMYLSYLQRTWIFDVINNKEFMEFFAGAFFGLLAVGVLAGNIKDMDFINMVTGSMAAGLASWQLSRVGGGFIGSFIGYLTGLFGSFAIGGAFGIYYWIGGAEENIFSSFFGTAFYGGLLGAFYSIIGIVVGLAIKDYFEEYRKKRKSSKV